MTPDHRLTCFPPAGGKQVFEASGIRFASIDSQLCVVRQDGAMACGPPTSLRSYVGRYANAQSPLPGRACAVTVDGSAGCYRDGVFDELAQGPYKQIAFPDGQPCALGVSGRLSCRPGAGGLLDGNFTGLTGSASAACAVRADGRVTCWGKLWPFGATYHTPRND